MKRMGGALHITNEGAASWSRTTKYGRKITYTMSVTQHPAQARACGLGSKSNTDRRPVDPPPILDLHVYEGEGNEMQDITFSYKANFFVWASLEFGRPMAHGRASQAPVNTPVLCGTPVAGISYLDRPDPAGYFIFPDLSVRHEGNYRINFTLYEDLKDRDYEDDSLTTHIPLDSGGLAECVNCRCEVRSIPFTVFSAKKFPGLQESTSLSRMVAEQGCRVRIRRDVRMRKRESKHSRDWDDYEDETADQRLEQYLDPHQDPRVVSDSPTNPTPHPTTAGPPSRHRIRSNSANNVTSPSIPQPPNSQQAPPDWMSQDTSRSYPALNQSSSQHVHSPAAPTYFHHSHRSSQEPSPLSTYGPATFVPDQHLAQSPQHMANPHMASFGMQVATNHGPWSYGQQSHQIQSPVYGPPVNHLRHNSMQYPPPSPSEYQHPSNVTTQYDNNNNLAQNTSSYPMAEPATYARQPHSHSSYSNERPTHVPSRMSAPYGMELPPLRHSASQPSFDRSHHNEHNAQYSQPANFVSPAVPPDYMSQPNGPTAQKRSYGSVFSTQPMEGPLRSGARPDAFPNVSKTVPDSRSGSDDDAQEAEIEETMQYRRADGTLVDRRWPTTN